MLPGELKKGDRLTADWLNRLVREAVARTLSVGPGLRLTRTPAGTNLSLAPQRRTPGAAGAFDYPWKVTAEKELEDGQWTGAASVTVAKGWYMFLGGPSGSAGPFTGVTAALGDFVCADFTFSQGASSATCAVAAHQSVPALACDTSGSTPVFTLSVPLAKVGTSSEVSAEQIQVGQIALPMIALEEV